MIGDKKKKTLFIIALLLMFAVMLCWRVCSARYQNTYTITNIRLQRIVTDDSILSEKILYILESDIEISSYDYSHSGGVEPLLGGCSDSLFGIRILNSEGIDIKNYFCEIDSINNFRNWVLDDRERIMNCFSIHPQDILTYLKGTMYFEKGPHAPGYMPLLLRLSCDSVVPEVLELHSKRRVIRTKVNNVPRKVELRNVFDLE